MPTTKTVYTYHAETGEFMGDTLADRSPLDKEVVWLMPIYSTEQAPPSTGEQQVAAFQNGEWSVQADWRGVPLWSKQTAQLVQARWGDTPESLQATTIAPPPEFAVWQGKKWGINTNAQAQAQQAEVESELARRRAVADAAITPLQDAVDLGMATEQELQFLQSWKRYRVELSRVPQQAEYPQNVIWPEIPGE
ncbi:tail fiber assembly protein [Neisseriaceae bacterium TC5R-5]|nr:tail fiber assembly protein [Neisseriaceae bacterium TC5R-5]